MNEEKLIGYLLADITLIPQLPEEITTDFFIEPNCSSVFKWLVNNYFNESGKLEAEEILRMSKETNVKLNFITRLQKEYFDSIEINSFKEICYSLKREFYKRKMNEYSSLLDQTQDIEKAIDTIYKDLEKTQNLEDSTQCILNLVPSFDEFLNDLESGKSEPPIMSGISYLDRKYRMRAGELHLLGGRPGSGKSAFTLRMAYEMVRLGTKVLYYSLEMREQSINARLASMMTGINAQPIEDNELSLNERTHVREAYTSIKDLMKNMDLIYDRIGVDLLEKKVKQCKPKVVFIDYLQRIKRGYKLSREEGVAENVRALSDMAIKHNCLVYSVVQLNRGIERSEKKIPTLADIRESGAAEQDADGVILIWQPSQYLDAEKDSGEYLRNKNVICFDVAKMRKGYQTKLKFKYEAKGYEFSEI
jgi:replicative DNA helicase